MFIFAKNTKDLLVTAGVVVSCGLFGGGAGFLIQKAQWGLVLGLLALLMAAGVLWGNKLGYLVTRYFWRGLAVLFLLGAVTNPFAWKDVLMANRSLAYFLAIKLLISIGAISLSYCLSEHAKLRQLEGADRWRSFP